MRELLIVISEGCCGSQSLRDVLAGIDWPALGVTVTWIPFDRQDPRLRGAGVFATPTGILDGQVLFMGVPDRSALLQKLSTTA